MGRECRTATVIPLCKNSPLYHLRCATPKRLRGAILTRPANFDARRSRLNRPQHHIVSGCRTPNAPSILHLSISILSPTPARTIAPLNYHHHKPPQRSQHHPIISPTITPIPMDISTYIGIDPPLLYLQISTHPCLYVSICPLNGQDHSFYELIPAWRVCLE